MRKIIIGLALLTITSLLLIFNYGLVVEKRTEGLILENYSHIIGKHLYLDSTRDSLIKNEKLNLNCNSIMFLVSSSCESCYIKLNKMFSLTQSNEDFFDVNVIVVIIGQEDENSDLIDLINKYGFNYIVDKDDAILKNNKYISLNQIYVVDNTNKVLF